MLHEDEANTIRWKFGSIDKMMEIPTRHDVKTVVMYSP